MLLAAVLVIALGYMALTLINQRKQKALSQMSPYELQLTQIQTQSESDNLNDIDKDLKETDLTNVDSELQDIDRELNQTN